MSNYIIAVSKTGKDVGTETDLNSFVFHSLYNTFKIIKTGVLECSVIGGISSQAFTRKHYLSFTPLITAFAKNTVNSNAFPPNTEDLNTPGLIFVSAAVDSTNVIFTFDKTGDNATVRVRYFCLEAI